MSNGDYKMEADFKLSKFNIDDLHNLYDNYFKNVTLETRDAIKIRFIQKDTENLDLMLDRLNELGVTTKNEFLKIASIYLGDVSSITTIFKQSAAQKYKLTNFETSIILNKITEDDVDIDKCNCKNNADENYREVYQFHIDKQNPTETKNIVYKKDVKIAMFRLIVGVAYRIFRSECSINNNNSKKVHNESYIFTDLITLVNRCHILCRTLNILDGEQLIDFKSLISLLESNLIQKESYSSTIDKCGYLHGKLNTELNNNIEMTKLASKIKNLELCLEFDFDFDFHLELNKIHDSDKLQKKYQHLIKSKNSLPYIHHKNRYNLVAVSSATDFLSKIWIKNAFWYDEFIPTLVKALSIANDDDTILYKFLENSDSSTKDRDELIMILNKWFESNFDDLMVHCKDVVDFYNMMTLKEKIIIKQCWDLTKDYLTSAKLHSYNNSECSNSVSVSLSVSDLSKYVPFIDEYVGKKYTAESTVSPVLPQYIGPPVWKILHSIPEMIDKTNKYINNSNTESMINSFKDFFVILLKTFPCPYCRDHMNNYVIKNTELLSYPIEYLLINSDDESILSSSMENKLNTIKNVDDLRLFLWKFHNAVNSSSILSNYQIESNSMNKPTNNSLSDYTPGYWPPISMFDDLEDSKTYSTIIHRLISDRKVFINIITNNSNKDSLSALKEHIKNSRISVDDLDKFILKSHVLTKTYSIVDSL